VARRRELRAIGMDSARLRWIGLFIRGVESLIREGCVYCITEGKTNRKGRAFRVDSIWACTICTTVEALLGVWVAEVFDVSYVL
jgi:hypothetical protein